MPSPAVPSLTAARQRSDALEAAIRADPGRFRVLTGDRPTGPLHVGHLFGTLLNRVRLQDVGVQVMVLIADYQALTDRDAAATLPADVLGLVADYLAAGLDPDRCTIFAHSQVPALNQLLLPFLSLVTVAEVSRNPTVKEEFGETGGSSMSALMFSYPVHQAADILACRANLVPVGRDQLPHLEIHPDHRPPVQRALQSRPAVLPAAGRAAVRRAAAARHRWPQDEQEPRQCGHAGRH